LSDNNTSIKDIVSKVKDKLENYSTDIALQNTILSIPGGPAIDVLIREIGSKISQQRIAETIHAIQFELDRLDSIKIDRDYVISEEFYDLVIRIFYQSVKDRVYEKKVIFAKILSRSLLTENKDLRENNEDFVNLLEDLSIQDLTLLKHIYDQQREMNPRTNPAEGTYNELLTVWGSGWKELQSKSQLTNEQYQISLLKLTRSGFIKEITGSYVDYLGGTYIITPILKKLLCLIHEL
jgi:hypothetical protein